MSIVYGLLEQACPGFREVGQGWLRLAGIVSFLPVENRIYRALYGKIVRMKFFPESRRRRAFVGRQGPPSCNVSGLEQHITASLQVEGRMKSSITFQNYREGGRQGGYNGRKEKKLPASCSCLVLPSSPPHHALSELSPVLFVFMLFPFWLKRQRQSGRRKVSHPSLSYNAKVRHEARGRQACKG